jgi:UDP-glucose 4-epimerase
LKAAVVGGAGFIGSHVVDHLLEFGDEVLVVDDFSTGRQANLAAALREHPDRVSVSAEDMLASTAVADLRRFEPEVIYLLAAQSSVAVSMKDPRRDGLVNIVGFLNVLEAARTIGCKVVFASSGGTIYGDVPLSSQPIVEEQRREPCSIYGVAKAAATDYFAVYEREFGLASSALALGNVYGPRQSPAGESGVVAIFAGRILRGQELVVHGDGETTRDYVHVSDVARAFRLAGAAAGGHGLVNIGTSIPTSVNQVAKLICGYAGDVRVVHGPSLRGEVRNVALDRRRAAEVLGWEPRVDLADGVRSVVDSLREGVGSSR